MKSLQVRASDVDLALYEWEGSEPTLLFLHATGFHGRIWDQVIKRLDDAHCFAVDQRGHGRSGKSAAAPEWSTFAADVVALIDHFGWSGALGVGHSIGGHALTAAAAARPSAFQHLLLIDPVILPEAYYTGIVEGEHFTAKRRAEWSNPDEMFERFRTRPPFDRWDQAVLRDYVTHGLMPNPAGGGCILACDPAFEAAIYTYGFAANIHPLLDRVQIPVTVMRALVSGDASPTNFSASPTTPDLAARLPHGQDIYLPQHTHFIPMEAPALVAESLRAMISAARS
ncbi:MAG: alpha/beta hydrolase [Anaerolineae bacterium]|nr:alpha/beta hydrolase [Anaerolineae bacterium]NUQ02414.1 alpha/beta hydrolase [Anaerolineae bacterium]